MRHRSPIIALSLAIACLLLLAGLVFQAHHTRQHSPIALTLSLPTSSPLPPLRNVRAPARVHVIVTSSPSDFLTSLGDSLCTILTRDFTQGDWIRVLPSDSAAIAIVVHTTLTPHGVRIELRDGTTGTVARTIEFPLPPPSATNNAWRWAIHGIADQLSAIITGHLGVAQSRIAYVAHHKLHVIDADGADDHIVAQKGMIMSPSWRHDGTTILYSNLSDSGTQVAEVDLSTGMIGVLSVVPRGLNITPVYSPDDRWIVFAHGSARGGTDLIAVSRTGGRIRRIISDGGDNTNPAFNAISGRIAFSAAHGHTPQIYSVNFDGTDVHLETPDTSHRRSYRASPDWSPDGHAIAFGQQNGNFQLWTVTLADHTLHRLTTTGENEDPAWAPDSRHLVFSATHAGLKNLWIVDVPTGRLRRLTTTGGARLAAWSPVGPHTLRGLSTTP